MKKIILTQGKTALVDDDDFDRLCAHRWYAHKSRTGSAWYAHRNISIGGKQTTILMHREILGFPDGQVDHVNMDGLDNRKQNIRKASHSLNNANRVKLKRSTASKFKGVQFSKKRGRWQAQIGVNGKDVWLGYFNTEEEAARAYDEAAALAFGDFARANFGGRSGF